MKDTFERVSTFYSNKKSEIQSKTCDFKLMDKNKKAIQTINIEMSKQVGNKNEPLKLNFTKQGLVVTAQFEIIPACRIKHAHLFGEEGEDN